MNFTQMHERLRHELLRRIQRGSLSVSLLARQTGFGQSHLSNFLHSRRQLSLEALDKVLAAQHLTAGDLLPISPLDQDPHSAGHDSLVPIVSHGAALSEHFIRPGATHGILCVPTSVIESLHPRAPSARRAWQRFVAIRAHAGDAISMEPVIAANAIVLLDRHYNSLFPFKPNRRNLYAVAHGAHLVVRYLEFVSNRLVLRPHNVGSPMDVIELEHAETPGDRIAGRVVMIQNET